MNRRFTARVQWSSALRTAESVADAAAVVKAEIASGHEDREFGPIACVA